MYKNTKSFPLYKPHFQIFALFFLRTKRQKKQKNTKNLPSKGHQVIYETYKVINQYFPKLYDAISYIEEPRLRKGYKAAELIMAGVAMFLFKEGSRNHMNQKRKEINFRQNYEKLFKCRLPHMDSVEDFFRILSEDEFERLKAHLVSILINKKVLHKFKFLGKKFVVAIDGTGLMSYDYDYSKGECLSRTSKNGNTTYFHSVLEAKLVTSNGLCISLATEWIYNDEDRNYDKQDCEQKAFKRLAVKLKNYFPQLPICIVADGLYPNQYFFQICNENKWNFIVSFQDGNLPTFQEEINRLDAKKVLVVNPYGLSRNTTCKQEFSWLNNLQYKDYHLSWLRCKEEFTDKKTGETTSKTFVHITNLEVKANTVDEISKAGRMRWVIENQGFNTQKNQDYALTHKFSRVSFRALKNYYQCLQIAHMINQLITCSQHITSLMEVNRISIKYLWELMKGVLIHGEISQVFLDEIDKSRYQIRLAA